jgi:hypothetical protein
MIRYLNGGGGEANYLLIHSIADICKFGSRYKPGAGDRLTSIRNQQSETESFIIRGFVLYV